MRTISCLLVTLAILPAYAAAQAHQTPYAGLDTRTIKALSTEEVEGYLRGEGLAFALAAELNHYPGPRHALDLASDLGLSGGQMSETRRVFERMQVEAVRLGGDIVARERALDSLFATGSITESELQARVTELAELRGKLRFTHLAAHIAMKRVLTPAQVEHYDRLRGYGAGRPGGHPH